MTPTHADEQQSTSGPDRKALAGIAGIIPQGVLSVAFHSEEDAQAFLRACLGAALAWQEANERSATEVLRQALEEEGLTPEVARGDSHA